MLGLLIQQKNSRLDQDSNQSLFFYARKSGDPVSKVGLGENFSLKLTTQDLSDGYPQN